MPDQNLDCNNPKACNPMLPISSVVAVFQNTQPYTNQDCSTNLLFLTDEAGKVNTADTDSLDYLSADNRFVFIGDTDDVDLHFGMCTRTYYELKAFFGQKVGTLIRPQGLIVAFKPEGESLLEALLKITECYTCFNVVSHVAIAKDGTTPIYDTDEQLELGEWGKISESMVVLPTHDYDKLLSAADVDSNPATSKQEGHWTTAYAVSTDICVPERDDACELTGQMIDTVGTEHIGLAAIMASLSDTSEDYNFTIKYKPMGNVGLTNSDTSALNLEQVNMVTGFSGAAGGLKSNSPHHANVYHNVSTYRMFMEGITATGIFIDDAMQRTYVKRALEKPIMELMMSKASVSMNDLSVLETRLRSLMNDLFNQNFMADEELDLSQIKNVIDESNGWYITREAISQDHIDRRVTPHYVVCYKKKGSIHFVSIGLCEATQKLTAVEG